uniref:Cytochrome P450 4F22 n=1 Tax=Phallusia mammillata TaxID=59560 RepID=A0A6F9DB12_9ASCI|nr:cytochrome P450 4F22 [Phallusia mammillata]
MLKQRSLSSNIDPVEASHADFVLGQKIKNGKHLDFLDILLLTRDEDGKGLTEREIRDEVDTFLFEGHDTTASGISWALYCLADNPQFQEKCRHEVVHLLQGRTEVLWSDLQNMPYLTMFIKEVLRLYPPVFAIARTTSQPVTFDRGFGQDQHCLDDKPSNNFDCGKTLESSTNIGIPLMVLHRNETVWKNPTVFDPSRFDKENPKPIAPFTYLPFSAGPRNCIGQNFAMAEMKVVLAKTLLKFRLYLDDECSKPEMLPMIVLKSKNGIHLKVERII